MGKGDLLKDGMKGGLNGLRSIWLNTRNNNCYGIYIPGNSKKETIGFDVPYGTL